MSDSVQPHRWQPTRLLCPWDSPGKNTGVGCHFLLQCLKVKSESEVSQSCLTLSDPHGLQPTRLLYPWEFSGESTGVGRQCLLRRKRAIGGKGIKFSLEPSLHGPKLVVLEGGMQALVFWFDSLDYRDFCWLFWVFCPSIQTLESVCHYPQNTF